MKNRYETAVRKLFDMAGISIHGPNPYDIHVTNDQLYQRIIRDGELGFGEGFMDGWWECEQLDELICRLLRAKVNKQLQHKWNVILLWLQAQIFNRQSQSQAFTVGQRHYDLGNDLYRAMLDERLNYTCAYWNNTDDLDEAQKLKLDLVCRKIDIKPDMTILELGCGWGSFSKYAAETYGARVLGVTVSKKQVELGTSLCQGLPIELRLQDYRDVKGKYDRVISIGIMEHVGYQNYGTYMNTVNRCLKENGLAFIHTIGSNESAKHINPWLDRYIFPNGMLPSMAQLSRSMENLFVVEDLHNIGPHYDRTLMAWWYNFKNAWPDLKKKYDDRFYRMWQYYLLSCAGAFRARHNQLWQMVMTRPGMSQPDCRCS